MSKETFRPTGSYFFVITSPPIVAHAGLSIYMARVGNSPVWCRVVDESPVFEARLGQRFFLAITKCVNTPSDFFKVSSGVDPEDSGALVLAIQTSSDTGSASRPTYINDAPAHLGHRG